jgi:hypothetical protein
MNGSRGLGPINLGHLHPMENHRHFLVGAGQRFDLLSHARPPLPAAQTDAEILRDEVSDEAIEAASVLPGGLPTLMHNTYCFACPVDNPQQSIQQRRGAADCGQYGEADGR